MKRAQADKKRRYQTNRFFLIRRPFERRLSGVSTERMSKYTFTNAGLPVPLTIFYHLIKTLQLWANIRYRL